MLKSGGLGTELGGLCFAGAEETRERGYRGTYGSSSDGLFAARRRAYGDTRGVPLDCAFALLWEVHRSGLAGA